MKPSSQSNLDALFARKPTKLQMWLAYNTQDQHDFRSIACEEVQQEALDVSKPLKAVGPQ
jgi:hypothetical protein